MSRSPLQTFNKPFRAFIAGFILLISGTASAQSVVYYPFNPKYKNWLFDTGLALVLGGIVGNFIDRLHLKYVIDMLQLDFVQFNIFNIADSAITVGIVLVFIYLIFISEKD